MENTMRYLLLIYSNEAADAARTPAENEAMYAQYGAFTGEVRAAGALERGDQLMPSTAATCVKVRNGRRLTTDGPYAETREQLGGYYLLNCDSLDDALGYAAKIPAAQDGVIEVRPIVEMNG
jgi:hypothetical protein